MSFIRDFNSKNETYVLIQLLGVKPEKVVNSVVEGTVNSKTRRADTINILTLLHHPWGNYFLRLVR